MGAVTAFDIAYLDIWTYHTYQYPKDQFDISFITYQCSSYVLIALFVPLQILWRDVASAKLTAVLTLSDLQYLADHRLFDQLQVWWDVVDRLSAYSFWSAVSLADWRISYQLQYEWLQVLKSLLRSTCLSQRESEIDRITCSSRDRPLVCSFVLCKYTHSTSHRANKHFIEKNRTNAYWLKVLCKTKCKYTQS